MRLRPLLALALGLGPPAAVSLVAAQGDAGERIAAGRAALQAKTFDSAAARLRLVTTDSAATAGERAEAWVWLGVVRYYVGDDSAAAAAFEEAVGLDPRIDAAGLERIDPALEEMFRAALTRSVQSSSGTPAERTSLHFCMPQCEPGLRPPALLYFPRLPDPDLTGNALLGPSGTHGRVVVAGIVNVAGRVEAASVRIVTATAPVTARALESSLRGAEFRPGRLERRPVRVMVEVRYECWRESVNRVSCRVEGP